MFSQKREKGQAFSTFQLLIAAVVALALLAVLLPLITGGFNIGNKPDQVAGELLQTQIDNPGALSYTSEVRFTKGTLAASGLVEDTGIDPDQVFFVINDELSNYFKVLGEDNDVLGPGKILEYTRNTDGKYQLGIICEYDTEIESTLTYYDDIPDDASGAEWAEDVKNCVIFPRRAS
jgi:hypothetical protein